ncbi:MAG: cell division protein FtsZ [Dysgonamonadaceae bacterium]|jgi:cell division protein FtsZ|nr:cell division protein FtsZ [Dysgonamonadaceae bacterium]
MEDVLTGFDIPREQAAIIKVIGVGGGGGNAVTHMYKEGIQNVTFALCNTDNQALIKSGVPVIVQLGKETTKGLGSGNKPHIAKQAAEESAEDIRKLLSDRTQMVFITAGMGGGTGTGAAPVIAKIAKDMDILTVGIVTIPFLFEGEDKILQALRGVEEIRKNVDALLVINNQRLIEMYGNLNIIEAFAKADSTLSTAARSIAEIITIPGIINVDFADVNTTLKDGGVAIMNSGYGQGKGRVSQAFDEALNSPLLNNNKVFNAKKILFNIYFSPDKPLEGIEMNEITDFMGKFKIREIKLIWGTAIDDTLKNDEMKVTVLAAGFGVENIDPRMENVLKEQNVKTAEKMREREEEEAKMAKLIDEYYGRGAAKGLGRNTKPKLFIFQSAEQMDDDEIIAAVITHPAYKRDSKTMLDIARKAENAVNRVTHKI